MKKYGLDLPAEKTRRVVLFEETSAINNNIKASVYKLVPGPEEYTVIISEYAGRNMWIVQNSSWSTEGEPIILPPVFASLEDDILRSSYLLPFGCQFINLFLIRLTLR